ncbi:MAG: hypothetical protein ABI564_10895 [Ideonella sp.]
MNPIRCIHGLRRWQVLFAATATAALLAACGGGDDGAATPAAAAPAASSVTLSGVAATGAAIANAPVGVINANGVTASATTNASGGFTINIADGAPYVLRVTDPAGRLWYSYAQGPGSANITPLTSLALSQAAVGRPLADVYNGWASSRLSAAQVLEAARVVNANLASVMQARGVTPASANIFTQTFTANGQGLDAVLDAIRVSFNCSASQCTPLINSPAGTALLNWNGAISVAGITLSWNAAGGGSMGGGTGGASVGSCTASPTAGSYSVIVQTSISGLGSVPVPEVCIDGLPGKPANQADFCSGSLASGQLPTGVAIQSCSYDGSVGTITARITTPITLDYTVKYTFVQR